MIKKLVSRTVRWALASGIAVAASTAQSAESYWFCKADADQGSVHYFHWDFHVEDIGESGRLPSNVLARAFQSYLRNIEGVTDPRVLCGFNAPSYSEAERERDKKISRYEERGKTVIIVNWYPEP